jgi:hypothetical protein
LSQELKRLEETSLEPDFWGDQKQAQKVTQKMSRLKAQLDRYEGWQRGISDVGVLVEVGRGRMSGQTVEDFLENPSREPARLTAPPSGLFLEQISY